MKNNSIWKKVGAEATGTFLLVFLAVGTAVMTGADIISTALAFGLVIVVLANTTIGAVSGCHINPAVSLGVLLTQKLDRKKEFGFKEFGLYVAAQFTGAVFGALMLYGILRLSGFNIAVWGTNGISRSFEGRWNWDWDGGLSPLAQLLGTLGSGIGAFMMEIILTGIFVFTILFAVNNKKTKKYAGFIIGVTLTLVHLIGIRFTGTSVNPARSFGPALMQLVFLGGAGPLFEVWIFLLAPMIGAGLAALLYHLVHQRGKKETAETNEQNADAEAPAAYQPYPGAEAARAENPDADGKNPDAKSPDAEATNG